MTVATISHVGEELIISPNVGSLREMKTLGAAWKNQAWVLPAAMMHLAAVKDLLPDLETDITLEPVYDDIPDDRLYPYQRRAAGRLAAMPRGQMAVMTPGLGKTAIAVVAADFSTVDQIVVVAPAPLLRTWEREIKRWGRRDTSTVIIHDGEPDWDAVQASRWLVTSWDVLARHQEWFAGKWPLWILDESVLAKSRQSQRSMAIRGGRKKARRSAATGKVTPAKKFENLRKSVDRVWLLSGSPTSRYSDDLWAQLNMIWPRAFPSYWRFAERYCIIQPNDWAPGPGTVVATRRDRDAVKDNADMIMVVNQEEVLDLPEYLFEAVDVDLTPKQQKAYDEMTRDFVATLDSGDVLVSESRVAQITRLLQIASFWEGASSKHDALVSLLEAGAYEAPYLIWTHWRAGAEALTERLLDIGLKVGHVYGGMSAKSKDALIEDYKRGNLDTLVLSLAVGKFGHTLTNTKTIAWVDKTWNADDYHQALRRVRRIGLTHRPISVTFRAPHTMDELVELNLEGKVEGISRVTNANLKELILGLGR